MKQPTLWQNLHDALLALGDLFMPRACIVCGRPLGMRERHLCLICAADLPMTGYEIRRHNPMADRFNALLERGRGTEKMEYSYAAALLFYTGGYKQIPRALKYHADLSGGRAFARLLGQRLSGVPHYSDVDLVIPVPLHWTRRWERGYNQAEVIARELASCLGVPCRPRLLARVRKTRSQARLPTADKADNVASAFRLQRPAASDSLYAARHILLVDDTFTTGATLYACYQALRPYVCARISIATLALAPGHPAERRR